MPFAASLSGLYANQQKLSVIGNNLANINTVAYKTSNVVFSDLVSQSVGGNSKNPLQVGLGVTTGAISPNFAQGGIQSDGIFSHMAIEGNGFFLVGSGEQLAYSRAGDFLFDSHGQLVTQSGLPVQGYTQRTPSGAIDTSTQPATIVISPGSILAPSATNLFSTVTNLDSRAAVGDTHATSVEVIDSLGTAHVLTATFTNTGPNAWDYSLTVPGADVVGGTAGTPFAIATGDLTFGAGGTLATVDGAAAADVTIAGFSWVNGSTAANVSWDLVDASGESNMTGYSVTSATSSVTQDGRLAGSINDISVNAAGELSATFGYGKTEVIAQLCLATFHNPAGLVKLGHNLFTGSQAAGQPSVGVPGTGGRGTIIGAALEQSNVDIAQEFTQMILAQRGYQANSKSIVVQDELLVESINLKR